MTDMRFVFDDAATVEAAVYLIQKSGGRINYTLLIKMLYLADREFLTLYGHPITGAAPCSMPQGPVLSEVYDYIKNKSIQGIERWRTHIQRIGRYEVELLQFVEPNDLSDAAYTILDKVHAKFENYTYSQIIDYCHKNCPEWKDQGQHSWPIQPEEILRAVGMDAESIKKIADEADHYYAVAQELGSV